MAGGTFDKLAGKVRPGTYINFVSTRHDTVGINERGIVVVPLLNHNYGPVGEFIQLTGAAPDAQYAKLGYSIYDNDPNRQMLLIREAFKNASTVYVYRVNGTEGVKAKIENEETPTLTVEAKYPGTRGNDLTVAIVENPTGGFDVSVYLGGSKVSVYEGLENVADLAAVEDDYVTFTGSGALSAQAGLILTGGTDATAQKQEVTSFLDALERIRWNTLAFPSTDDDLHTAAKNKITYIRESVGRGVQVVMPDTKAKDYEGVINVTNSVKLSSGPLSHAEACAWVAGVTAGASNTQSNTYVAYEGAEEVVDPKTHEEAVAAINAGEFFFSISEEGEVVVEYDINSLTSFKDGKDKTYRKNRVIRVFDTFAEAVQLNFQPNKYDNSPDGWAVMEGIGKTILRQFADAGAITNVDYDADFKVDQSLSKGDETYFNVGLQAVDSAEKLYFTIATR